MIPQRTQDASTAPEERRAYPRHRAGFAVHVASGPPATTRDLSTAGIYVILDADPDSIACGDRLPFTLRLDWENPAQPVELEGTLNVVRVERLDRGVGVAARVEDWGVGRRPDEPR